MPDDNTKALEERIKALEHEIDKQKRAFLHEQIKPLKTEFLVRLESIEKVFKTEVKAIRHTIFPLLIGHLH